MTSILVSARLGGESRPEVTHKLLMAAETASDIPVHDRADRFIQRIEHWTGSVGQHVDVYGDPKINAELRAWTESVETTELEFLENYLRERRCLTNEPGFPVLCVEGYARIAELTVGNESKRVFVAMSFDDEMKRTYRNAIKPAIQQAGFEAYIVGEGRSTERIEDEAEGSIRESRFVVADFTHGNRDARGSVYYEAGFARGLGKPIVFMAKDGTQPHFNNPHFPHIFWNNDDDLTEQLTQRIRNMPQLNAREQNG